MNDLLVGRFVTRRSLQAFTPKQGERASGFTGDQRERVSAFTLLELLVVITIIGVLISFLFPAFRGVQDQAKRVQAKNDLNQIATAISAFYTEYGKYPVAPALITDVAATYGTSRTNDQLFNVLRNDTAHGDNANVTALNPRQIVFIEPPIAKDQTAPKLGVCTGTSCANAGAWYDPWGFPYNVTIDANYNAVAVGPAYTDLTSTYASATDGSGEKGARTAAVAWTMGPDNALGNNGDNKYKDPATGIQSDDVISWQ